MTLQHLKETESSRESSNYAIFPLQIYSHQMADNIFFVSHHWHDEMEIIWIESGEFMIHINGIAHLAKPGEIYFINSQEIHQITAITSKSLHHAIVFNPKIIRFEWHDPLEQRYLNPLIRSKIKYPTQINKFPKVQKIILQELNTA